MRITNLLSIVVVLAFGASAQAANVRVLENFDSLNGGPSGAFVDLNGQGGWNVTGGTLEVRNDFQLNGFDGNIVQGGGQAVRDFGNFGVSERHSQISFSLSARSNPGRFSRASVGFFDGANYFPGILVGATNTEWAVSIGNGAVNGVTTVGSSTDGYPGVGDPLTVADISVTIDLSTFLGTVTVDTGSGAFVPAGLSDLDFSGLGFTGVDGRNLSNLNAFRIRNLNFLDGVDNLLFVATIPEPSTGLLLGVGLFGLVMRRKTRSRV